MIIRTQFLYRELPIRLAQRIMELYELPYNLLKLGCINNVYNLHILLHWNKPTIILNCYNNDRESYQYKS